MRAWLSTCVAHLQAGAANATWSASWKAPSPRWFPADEPPSTTSGIALSVATYIGVTAFVSAGPDPTTSTPGFPRAQPQAEAAKPADTSCRQFTTVIPSRSMAAMTSIMGPATTPKAVSMPAAFSCRAMICPPFSSATPCPPLEVAAIVRPARGDPPRAYNRAPPPRPGGRSWTGSKERSRS